jgi:hypothetical protein
MISNFLPFIYIKQNCVTLTLTAPTGWGEWTNKATQVQPIAHTRKHSYQLTAIITRSWKKQGSRKFGTQELKW